MKKLKKLAPWLALGPITGPLAEGMHRNLRRGETVLAWLYALAVVVTWIDMLALMRVLETH